MPIVVDSAGPPSILDLARCPACGLGLEGLRTCLRCSATTRWSSGILDALGELSGSNRIAASFFDGPGWTKFRPWERLFLRVVGGRVKARREILRHLPSRPGPLILEVGIGDGENVDLVDDRAEVYGADIARTQLSACIERFPSMAGRLCAAEAERLPFPDRTFDAVYSIGGFNYFADPDLAAAEMRRVTRPNGVVVIADERPDLKRFGLGHLIGFPACDAWWMRRVGLPADFVDMILRTQIDPGAILAQMSPSARRVSIWKGLGYLLIDSDPSWSRP